MSAGPWCLQTKWPMERLPVGGLFEQGVDVLMSDGAQRVVFVGTNCTLTGHVKTIERRPYRRVTSLIINFVRRKTMDLLAEVAGMGPSSKQPV